jgi:hypothetical protein
MSAAVYGNGIRRGVGIHKRASGEVYFIENNVCAGGGDISKGESLAGSVIAVSLGYDIAVFEGYGRSRIDVETAVF